MDRLFLFLGTTALLVAAWVSVMRLWGRTEWQSGPPLRYVWLLGLTLELVAGLLFISRHGGALDEAGQTLIAKMTPPAYHTADGRPVPQAHRDALLSGLGAWVGGDAQWVAGRLEGRRLDRGRVYLEARRIRIVQGDYPYPELELVIRLKESIAQGLPAWQLQTGGSVNDRATIYASWRPGPNALPKTRIYRRDFRLSVHVRERGPREIVGRLRLLLPDEAKSYALARFKVVPGSEQAPLDGERGARERSEGTPPSVGAGESAQSGSASDNGRSGPEAAAGQSTAAGASSAKQGAGRSAQPQPAGEAETASERGASSSSAPDSATLRRYVDRRVRVVTVAGRRFEGILTGVDAEGRLSIRATVGSGTVEYQVQIANVAKLIETQQGE